MLSMPTRSSADFFYSECASLLRARGQLERTADAGRPREHGSSSAIAMDRTGRVHIVYRSDRLQTLQYATCAYRLHHLTSWSFATVDNSSSLIGINPAICGRAEMGSCTPPITTASTVCAPLSRCLALCSLDANWANRTARHRWASAVGRSSAIVMDGAARHVVYQDSRGRQPQVRDVSPPTASASVTGPCSAISLADGGQDPSLALGPNQLLAVTYYASTDRRHEVRLLCQRLHHDRQLDHLRPRAPRALVGQASSLTVDAYGRVQAIFVDERPRAAALRHLLQRLHHLPAAGGTARSTRAWRLFRSPVLVPSRDGGIQMLYLSSDGEAVRFAE